ncbi:hypothetical protein [Listeria booriae]|uniref:hypothetical protein n=1 Tax=Listeria booriae TaxID=1552123 RepID=UPI00162331FE|nr:hypothetical protein [Listeria booriae]MBC2163880.1 hypothetical protein [Listeria booriae]
MSFYKAYDITTTVNDRQKLSDKQIENMDIIVGMILENLLANRILYQVPSSREEDIDHPIVRYNINVFNNKSITNEIVSDELDILADKLLYEEQVVEPDGTRRRNKKIREGLLFAKQTDKQLILLKFDETKIIDRNTFSPIDGLSLEKQYYKIVVIDKNDMENIVVVDRNKVIAKYWASGFLELERQRDSFVNTTDLIECLEENQLINQNVGLSEEDYDSVKGQILDYIFENRKFDKEEVFASLEFDKEKYEINAENLFEDDIFTNVDEEFDIDNEVLVQRYRRTIKVSNFAKVSINDLPREIKRNSIKLEGNRLILKVDKDYKEEVQKMFGKKE